MSGAGDWRGGDNCFDTDSVGVLRIEELSYEILSAHVEESREFNDPCYNLLVYSNGLVIVEGRVPRQHLKNQYPERPPVNAFPVSDLRPLDDLGGEVFRGPAERVSAIVGQDLGEPKVSEFNVPVLVD